MSDRELVRLDALLDHVGPLRLNRYIPSEPSATQEAFLRLRAAEVLYGGAAGSGKSVALLMAALMYADVPGYHALLLRPSLAEFDLPGGLLDLSHRWLDGSDATWVADARCWRFPGGGSLVFGYLDGPRDLGRYQGSSFSFLGFDELTRFDQVVYQRISRVLRQPDPNARLTVAGDGVTLADVPVRIRATTNPGGPGHGWVRAHFVDPVTRGPGVVYLHGRIDDNPHLDRDAYRATLSRLGGAERRRLLVGDWDVPDDGEVFQRAWFSIIERHELPQTIRAVRSWDFAATEPGPGAPDPDATVGVRLEIDRDGTFYITDIARARVGAGAVEDLVRATAEADGDHVSIVLEEEPGAAGKSVSERFKRHVLRGYEIRTERPSGPKQVRARNVAAAAENGLVKLVRGRNTNTFLDELAAFPNGAHDDCVDALAGAHKALARERPGRFSITFPDGTIYNNENGHPPAPARRRPPSSKTFARTLAHEHDETARLAASLGLPYTTPNPTIT